MLCFHCTHFPLLYKNPPPEADVAVQCPKDLAGPVWYMHETFSAATPVCLATRICHTVPLFTRYYVGERPPSHLKAQRGPCVVSLCEASGDRSACIMVILSYETYRAIISCVFWEPHKHRVTESFSRPASPTTANTLTAGPPR